MKTAVIYARYSSDSQTEQSIEGQLRECRKFAERNDMLIVDTYIDRAMTGTNDNRFAFQKMLRDSSKRQWEIVIVYKLDRFSRNKYESVIHKKTLKDNGVKIVSAMENIPDSPEGTLMESVLEGFNQYFSEELTQKVNRGLRESWLKGNVTGGGRTYGYNAVNKKYIVNENESLVVKEIFERYANGEPASSIISSLTERRIYRPNGFPFDKKYIYHIIHNTRYIGSVVHQGVTYTNIFPRIISDDLWRRIAAITEENKINPSRKKDLYNYILTDKIVCGKCHRKMHGESGTSHTGETYFYYVCKGKRMKQSGCKMKSVLKSFIEDKVINITNDILERKGSIRKIAENILEAHKKAAMDNTTLNNLMRLRAEAYKASQNIIKAIEQGIITEMTKSRLSELESQINKLDFDISMEKRRTYTFLSLEQIELYLNKHILKDTTNLKARKILVNTFIREVLIYSDKIVITYNFIDPIESTKITKEKTEEIVKKSKSAFSLDQSSLNYASSAPNKKRYSLRVSFFVWSKLKRDSN